MSASEPIDFIPPGPGRVLPAATDEERLTQGGAVSPGKAWIRCTCSHAAWRSAPQVDSWICGCPPKQCHPPKQILVDGAPQLEWGPFVIRPFPAPDAA